MKPIKQTSTAVSGAEALNRLKEGNARFTQSIMSLSALGHHERRKKFQESQNPFAIVLSCSDSRVPSEIVFDQGLGDLFVIRVAGNIVAPSIVGSIEFAASTFGTQLVVVMGHSQCGAVSAALDVEQIGKGVGSENIRDIVDRITPAIRPLILREQNAKQVVPREILLDHCIKANVSSSVHQLKHGSPLIENLVNERKLMVVGAEYLLNSGNVEFWDSEDQALLHRPSSLDHIKTNSKIKSENKESNNYVQ